MEHSPKLARRSESHPILVCCTANRWCNAASDAHQLCLFTFGPMPKHAQNIAAAATHPHPCSINLHPRRWALLGRSTLLDYESAP